MAEVNARSPVRYPAWQREYEAVALEDDPKKKHRLLCDAQSAIVKRLQSLTCEDSESERQAINNAMTFLRLLEREHTHDVHTTI